MSERTQSVIYSERENKSLGKSLAYYGSTTLELLLICLIKKICLFFVARNLFLVFPSQQSNVKEHVNTLLEMHLHALWGNTIMEICGGFIWS